MTNQEMIQQRDAFSQAYLQWMNETAAQCQSRFALPIAEIIQDMKAENINTATIEGCNFQWKHIHDSAVRR